MSSSFSHVPPKKRKVSLDTEHQYEDAVPDEIPNTVSSSEVTFDCSSTLTGAVTTTKRSKQKTYLPNSVKSMTKEEISAWRKEARRVRNRQSAAASREKVRSRITELEAEVAGWKMKYEIVMSRIQVLEDKLRSEGKS
jgi:hypothetical protein